MKANILRFETTHAGFFELRRLTVEHDLFAGGTTGPLVREVLHRSDVAAAILYDPAADKVVLTKQYRSGAHLAGVNPWLVDIVAGRIDPGEAALEAIAREIAEESGLIPHKLESIGEFLTAPHLSSEKVFLYCATVDAAQAKGLHGVAREGEDIRVVVMPRAEAVSLAQSGPLSLWAALALNWLKCRTANETADVQNRIDDETLSG